MCYCLRILIIILAMPFHAMGEDDASASYDKALKRIVRPDANGCFRTLNNMGSMAPTADPCIQMFLQSVREMQAHPNTKISILEVGTAYGNVAYEALKLGVSKYIAIDLEDKHLQILTNIVKAILPNQLDSLELHPITFPGEEYILPDTTIADFILSARTLHFLTPNDFDRSIRVFYRLLRDNGTIFISTLTPYIKPYEWQLEKYRHEALNNLSFPISCKGRDLDKNVLGKNKYEEIIDHDFLLLTKEAIKKIIESHGFEVLYVNEYPFPYDSSKWSLDGRELVCVIAKKLK